MAAHPDGMKPVLKMEKKHVVDRECLPHWCAERQAPSALNVNWDMNTVNDVATKLKTAVGNLNERSYQCSYR